MNERLGISFFLLWWAWIALPENVGSWVVGSVVTILAIAFSVKVLLNR